MKVLLVDDHPLILSALEAVIRSIGSKTIVVGTDSAAAARQALATQDDIDLVLLDLALGDADGYEVLVEFRTTYPAIPVVVVSASDRTADVIRAIDGGAMGFVPKSSSHSELHRALGMVMSGAMYVPPSMLGVDFVREAARLAAAEAAGQPYGDESVSGHEFGGAPLGSRAAPEPHQKLPSLDDVGLTPRQREVLGLLLQGLPNKLIARQLNLSVETVKDHVAAVLRALGVSSRTQAVLAVSQMTQGRGGFMTRLPNPQ
jgi:DNA-binding NarL/FixJ family response regulator